MLATFLLTYLLGQQPALPAGAPTTQAARPERKVAPPRLAIDPSGRVNLGSVGPEEIRLQSYTFRNTSDQPIRLRVLDLSPGVTVEGPALQGPIAPKGSAQLTLRVDPSGFVGWQPRNVKLGTDDPGQGEYFLPIGLTVRPDLTVDALKKSFGEVALHETPQIDFRFRCETGKATKLWISSPVPAYLEAEVASLPAPPDPPGNPPATTPRDSFGAVKLVLRPAKVDPGMLAGLEAVTVESSAPHQPKFQLYLDWKLKLPVQLSAPRVIFLNSGEWTRTLILEGRNGKSFRLESARLEGEGFELAGVPAGPAARVELQIRRIAKITAKSILVLAFQGEPLPVRVPVSYLPPADGKRAPARPAPPGKLPER